MNRSLRFKAPIWALSVFTFVILSFGLAYGQAISGNIVGTVVDSSGAAVTGADVVAHNVATGVNSSAKTNSTGGYRFDNLPIGAYQITAKASGFQTTTLNVDVQLNKSGTANITLTPGSASTTIEVAGVAETLDTTTAQIQTTYEAKMLEDLPTANLGVNTTTGLNLGVLNLSMLDAGASSTGGLGAGVGPSLSGERPRNNNFTIEGVDNNNKGITGPLVYVPADAVSNFTVLQNQFSPEFGHSNGGQFNIVVKSGTNSFHGAAYEYFQNRNLNAIDQSVANSTTPGDPIRNPRYDSNRYGGQVGGPIFKSKLFFFANYEYNEVGQASVPGAPLLAPTSDGYAAMLAIPNISTANVQALQKYAQAPVHNPGQFVTVGGVQIPVGTLPIRAPNFTNFKALTTAMDFNISERDQIRGRYIYNQSAALDTAAQLPEFYTPLVQPFHLATISEYHTFTPGITNEFRVGFNRFAQTFVVGNQTFLPTLDAFPNITINDLGNLNVGPDPNAPQFAIQNTYQAIDNLTWVKGPHTLTFGGEYRKYISPQKFIQRSRGDYAYKTLDSFAFDQLPGGSVAERSFGNVGYSGDQHAMYGFVNDIWKIRRNVSLNLGVRYEYTNTPYGWTQQSLNSVADVPGLITFGSPKAPTKDFMPRVGFAYSPGSSGNTSIRGGFGMGYDVLYDNIGVLERPPQIGSTVDCPNPVCKPLFLANGGIPPENLSGISVLKPADARAATSAFLPNNVKYPYSETWNLGIQHVFAKEYTADIRYVGTRGVDLNVQTRLNTISGAGPGQQVPTFINAPDAATIAGLGTAWASAAPICNVPGGNSTCAAGAGDFPGTLSFGYNDTGVGPGGFYDPRYLKAGFVSPITSYQPWGASTYHGLQTQLNRRFSNGLQFQVAYTWSHMIDNSTADFFSTVIAPRRPQDFRNLQAERSNSLLDHRHRLAISTIYDAQWFKHDPSWFKRNLLGNYEIAPVFIWESGQWGTVQSGQDSNLNLDAASDRAIFNPAGTPGVGSDVDPITNSTACGLPPCIVGWVAQNPNAQYIIAGLGTVPTAPRSTIQTPPINNWDITLSKHIYATERVHLELLASFLNAFNHPQFVTGSPNQGQPISDTGSQRNFLIPNSPNFEDARFSFPSNARQTVLGLKLSF
jgi:hypothetical protein